MRDNLASKRIQIINAARVIDGHGKIETLPWLERKNKKVELPIIEIKIAPLQMGWGKPLPNGYLQGAYAPLRAILAHKKEIKSGTMLVISGRDYLKTEYSQRERRKLFEAYGEGKSFLTEYHRLTQHYIFKRKISARGFTAIRDTLFENYWRTWQSQNTNAIKPEKKWFEPLTEALLFRGVDCANPLIDFEGRIIVVNSAIADLLEIAPSNRVSIRGIGIAQSGEDGPGWIPQIAQYDHLRTAFEQALHMADIDLKKMVLSNQARLGLYTCYPIVPLGFLLETGWGATVDELRDFLKKFPITIDGGLNLSRAPANNTTLNDLISIWLHRKNKPGIYGIHSVCALGHIQAFAILTTSA